MFIQRAVLLALVTGLALPAEQALADDPPPPDIPAVAAYVEMVPTSRGPRPAGAAESRPRPLTPRVDELLQASGGDDAAMLEQLATSPGYGAPTGKLKQPRAASETSMPARSDALSAAISVSTDGGESRLLGLIVALLGVTVAVCIVAARRRPRAST
jgi:hypothetical protein